MHSQFIEDALNETSQPASSRNLSSRDSAMVDPLDALRDDLALAKGFKSRQKGRRKVSGVPAFVAVERRSESIRS